MLRHAIGLVENDNLVSASFESDFLLSKHFDLVAHDIDATIVRGVQLEHGLFVHVGAQQLPRQTQYGRGLARAWRTRYDEIGQVALFAEHFKPIDGLLVAHNVLQVDGPVFFDPRQVGIFWLVFKRTREI